MNTEQFLRAILPSSGNYFLALPYGNKSKGYKHLAYQDIHAMAAKAIDISNKGINAYFACASFEQPEYTGTDSSGNPKTKYRTGENAQYAKAQWLDLDGDQKENLVQLAEFCKKTGLPRPNIRINSGNGVHVYWTFTQDIPKALWIAGAKLFKDICQHYDLGQQDTSRTADISSVLRPVGTNNDKTAKGLGIKPVKLLGEPLLEPLVYRVWIEALRRIADDLGIKQKRSSQAPVSDMNDDLSGGTEFKPSSALQVAENCNQMRMFRDLKGVGQSEPLWRACIGILKKSVGGADVLHEWSSGHPEYDYATTQAKYDGWTKGPSLCSSFAGLDRSRCDGCEYFGKISTPLSLGEVAPVAITEVEYVNDEGETVKERMPDLPGRFGGDFRHSDLGLEAIVRTDRGQSWHLLSEAVPRVVEYYQDVEDMAWKAVVDTYIKPGHYHKAVVDVKAIAQGGSALLGALGGSLCVSIKPGAIRLMESYMHTWIEEIRKSNEETAMHTHMGWYDDGSFLLGDRKYLPNGDMKKVMLKSSIKRLADTMVPVGDLERYKFLIDKAYNRPGHEAYQFTWLAGFGSVLLNIMHPEPIGIIFDGWSSESGYGKSTVAKLATGIWGRPDITDADGTTAFALYVNAGMRKNLPMVLDEATNWEGERIGKFAYRYGSGRAKEQGMADGGIKDNSSVNWCNFVFTNGNKCMSDVVAAEHSNSAPQLARIFEYKFTAGHDKTLDKYEGPEVFAELFTIYGVAGDLFIQYVVKNRKEIAVELNKVRQEVVRLSGVEKDARFWAMGAAANLVAERITKDLGLHKFDAAGLLKWVIARMAGMRVTSRAAVKDVSLMFGDMMSDLQAGFIVTNNTGDRRSDVASYAPGYGPPRGAVTGRVVVGEQVVYLSLSAMADWCKNHDINPKDMKATIRAKGWDKGEATFRLGTGTLVALPPTSTIKLDWKAFGSNISLVKEDPVNLLEEAV